MRRASLELEKFSHPGAVFVNWLNAVASAWKSLDTYVGPWLTTTLR